MDRRVKERLIGASILVVLIVLVVPELLSGPKFVVPSATPAAIFPASAPEPTRNVTVDLATSKAPANSEVEPAEAAKGGEAAPTPAPSTDGSSSTAVSTSTAPTSTASESAAPASAAPATDAAATAKPVETAAPSPISTRAAWAVQLGSFASRTNADNLSRRLKGQGFSVYVLSGGSGASVRYRVRVGPLADRDSAERTAAKLKSIGHASSLVAPAG
ncbi:MAG TPA: SPOR domain-containing protein [Steroidobacteraceae bacterium]|nr:SPOR domain-containing protein [Steroidobacteraceae bacterium]